MWSCGPNKRGINSPETTWKCFDECGFGAEEVSIEEVIELPPPDDKIFQLMDDSDWAEFVQFDRNFETADTLNDKVIYSEQDDDEDNDDDDGVPPHTLYVP